MSKKQMHGLLVVTVIVGGIWYYKSKGKGSY